MKTQILIPIISAVLIAAVLITAGCTTTSAPETESPVGTWALSDEYQTTLVLDEKGNAGGHAPINTYAGKYTVSGNKLQFGELISTKMAGDPERMQAEDNYFENLHNTAAYSLANGQLILYDAEGKQILSFKKQ